jgi:FMN reductase
MSIMSLANSLMLDFRCLIVPRFVYAVGTDFTGDEITSAKILERTEELCGEMIRIARALRS